MKLFSFVTVSVLSLFTGTDSSVNSNNLPEKDTHLMNLQGTVKTVSTNFCTTKLVAGKPEKDTSINQKIIVFNIKGFVTAVYDYGSRAQMIAITEKTYDAQDRLLTENFFDDKSVYTGGIASTYNSKGNKITETDDRTYSYRKDRYGYDEKDNKNYEENISRSDTQQYIFKYNSLNQLIEKTNYNLKRNVKYYTETYTYDQNGKLIEELEDEFSTRGKLKDTYTYDSKGRLTGSSRYRASGDRVYNYTQSYDPYDNPLAYYRYDKDGKLSDKQLRLYTYDDQGNWITQFFEIAGETYFMERLLEYF